MNGKKQIPIKIEDIYPLTIVQMRYGGKIVIFNCDCDVECVDNIQGVEDYWLKVEEYMSDKFSSIVYGIGENLEDAFKDYKERYETI